MQPGCSTTFVPFPASRGASDRRPSSSPFDRQLDAARRLAPAEAFRHRAAVLLWCGEPVGLIEAEAALRAEWPLDEVHAVRCPASSWAEAFARAPGTVSWLARFILREIHERDPALLAILAGAGPLAACREDTPRALVEPLRAWGVTAPLAVLRPTTDGAVEWLERPAAHRLRASRGPDPLGRPTPRWR